MPNQNAIVGRIVRIDPSVEAMTAVEALTRYPDGFRIVFEGDQTVQLFPGDRAAGILQVLEGLRQLRAPAYIEVDPQTRGIARLLIPVITKVAKILERAGEGMLVELTNSHARHLLARKNPDYATLLDVLRTALAQKAP